MMTKLDIAIIGGGIIGLSTAMQIKQNQPKLNIILFEKEAQLSQHQTGHNSGVIHAGVYYKPGSLQARFCHQGEKAAKDYCQQNNIRFETPGKIIAATNQQEDQWLENLFIRCQQNDINPQRLTLAQVKKMQPGLQCTSAFFVPQTGIVNWQQVSLSYAEKFKSLGGKIALGHKVTNIHESDSGIEFISNQTSYQANYLISCAGLHADKIIKATGHKPNFLIMPFRGEYYRLKQEVAKQYKHLIYPVPNPALPFLGIHFTPMISGEVTVGPNAVLALSREGYRWRDMNFRESLSNLSQKAFWKMLWQHKKAAINELRSSLSKRAYLKLLHKYNPDLKLSDLSPYPAGVRAQALSLDGNLIHDFIFQETPRTLHTCNTPSPAATSSLPIGEHIAHRILEKIA